MSTTFIIMGVSGSGKTTIGKAFAQQLNLPFYDADDFHPQVNVDKMSSGIALNDDDRQPWLDQLATEIYQWNQESGAVLACSALKNSYRQTLSSKSSSIQWVYLEASEALIRGRFEQRTDHYMPDSLIKSQFDALEVPSHTFTVKVDQSVDDIVYKITQNFKLQVKDINKSAAAQVGVIGLGVMGTSLARNLATHDLKVAIINPPITGEEHVTKEITDRYPESEFIGSTSYKDFVATLSGPPTILIMVKAGAPVDSVIEELLPYLPQESVLIDGGNSHYSDTQRRMAYLHEKGIYYVGMGVSGGEEGALKGPAMMPGGHEQAKSKILSVFTPIAAKADDGNPCISWIGAQGSGHFVKMLHNGLEYADMQVIAELYDIMRRVYGLTNEQMADVFAELNTGELECYLLSITVDILKYKENGHYVLDSILDVAGQKGTGKWTIEAGLKYGVAIPAISAAVDARMLSTNRNKSLINNTLADKTESFSNDNINTFKEALSVAKILTYVQGINLIKAASDAHDWQVNLKGLVGTWRGGCIIRAKMLYPMMIALSDNPSGNLLADEYFADKVTTQLGGLKAIIQIAMDSGVPVPGMSSAYNYLSTISAESLPVNLIQAQRDYFGAHTYEKKDEPRGAFYHTKWGQ